MRSHCLFPVWNKLLSPCYKVNNGNRLATSCFNKTNIGFGNKLLRACCHQLVASLLASSTLLQDDNNLFQTCYLFHYLIARIPLDWVRCGCEILFIKMDFRHLRLTFTDFQLPSTVSYSFLFVGKGPHRPDAIRQRDANFQFLKTNKTVNG